jgi:predicted DNA-binding transcriptional regulator YafY
MFQTFRTGVTVRHIMDEFEITKQSAQRWLDEMTMVYTVMEIGENRTVKGHMSRNTVPPQPQKVYGLMR